uniref:ABA 8-oxidase n=1 Tax=Oryza brachyantha TaxID=4533 RepID=J3MY42_ORYBR
MAASFAILVCFFVSLAFLSYVHYASRQRRKGHEKAAVRLPPGSMGWPYIGETLQLYSQDPNVFFASKQKRYGDIFKTHILGCPCVMLASPDAARFVLVTQSHLFRPTYPRSKERMIGPWALFFHQGDYHLRLRKLVQGPLGPDALRALVPDVEAAVRSTLASWDGNVASTFHAMKRLSFDVGIVTIFGGRLDERRKAELRQNYSVVEKGYNSFPNSFPGTLYYKAIQARRRLHGVLSDIMRERRARGEPGGDLLGCLMQSRAGGDDVAGGRRRRRAPHRRAGRRQRHRRAVRGAGHDGQRAHLDRQVPPRPPQAARGRQGGAGGDPRRQRRRQAAADVGADAEHGANPQGDFGELKDGQHHLVHIQGGRG